MIILCSYSCIKKSNINESRNSDTEKNLIHRYVYFPDSIHVYRNTKINVYKSEEYLSSPFKLFVYIDGDCSCSIMQFDKWMTYIEEIYSNNKNVLIIFIVSTIRPSVTINPLTIKQSKANFLIIWDKDHYISSKNRLPNDPNYRTFLLDKENKILLYGCPIFNEKIKEFYDLKIKGQVQYTDSLQTEKL